MKLAQYDLDEQWSFYTRSSFCVFKTPKEFLDKIIDLQYRKKNWYAAEWRQFLLHKHDMHMGAGIRIGAEGIRLYKANVSFANCDASFSLQYITPKISALFNASGYYKGFKLKI